MDGLFFFFSFLSFDGLYNLIVVKHGFSQLVLFLEDFRGPALNSQILDFVLSERLEFDLKFVFWLLEVCNPLHCVCGGGMGQGAAAAAEC